MVSALTCVLKSMPVDIVAKLFCPRLASKTRFLAGSISHGVDVLFPLCLVVHVQKQAGTCATHTHGGLLLAAGAEWGDEYTQLKRKVLSSFFPVLSQGTVHYSTVNIGYRMYSSDQPFYLNTLRCCQPCSLWTIWWVVIGTYTLECHSSVEYGVRVQVAVGETEQEEKGENVNLSTEEVRRFVVKYNFYFLLPCQSDQYHICGF